MIEEFARQILAQMRKKYGSCCICGDCLIPEDSTTIDINGEKKGCCYRCKIRKDSEKLIDKYGGE